MTSYAVRASLAVMIAERDAAIARAEKAETQRDRLIAEVRAEADTLISDAVAFGFESPIGNALRKIADRGGKDAK